jgi:hypothetical protein
MKPKPCLPVFDAIFQAQALPIALNRVQLIALLPYP